MRDAGHRTPDAGHRPSDNGHRTSDSEKSKNNISTPQGGGHNNFKRSRPDTHTKEPTSDLVHISKCIICVLYFESLNNELSHQWLEICGNYTP